ncbi:MAG: metal ABC transporter permease [Pseudomonas sp.]
MMLDWLWSPFVEFTFMRRALFGGMALACSAAPLGVFLILRRVSMMGDAIAHGMLPGVALSFLLAGFSLPSMTLGGLLAGLGMAALATAITRRTGLRADASLAALYPISLAAGVLLLGLAGRRLDLMHILFGSALAVDREVLLTMLGVSVVSLLVLASLFRLLLLDSLDPLFMRGVSRFGPTAYGLFLGLVVINLVIGFQAIGALMVIGLMMLPAAAARFWSRQLLPILLLAAVLGAVSVWLGLLLSFHLGLATGPCIVLVAGAVYLLSVLFGPVHGVFRQPFVTTHH